MIVGGCTVADAHDAIVARCEEIAAKFHSMPTKTTARAPVVYSGVLPSRRPGDEQFPWFLVAPIDGEDTARGADEEATGRWAIIIGIYGADDDAWRDLLNVIDAFRNSFGAHPMLGGAIRHVGPLQWETDFREQPTPQWLATITINILLPRPEAEAGAEV